MATPSSNLTVQNWFETTLSSSISASDTSIPLNTVPTGSEGFLIIEPDSSTNREVIFFSAKTASEVTCPSAAQGRGQDGTSGAAHSSGATVRMNFTKGHFDALQSGAAVPIDTYNPSQILGSNEFIYDHVASGCVITGTGYGSTLNWSMTSGVVYIGGERLTVAAATGTVTASKDTYFDLLDPGTSTIATLVNTGGNIVANNAASPALAANSVRIGIVVSGAGSIASVASINQGEENKVLPIASSTPYAVTDSLGNLICPRDPQRKILGYRQILSSASFTTNATITGLVVPVIVPTGRKIKVSVFGSSFGSTAAANMASAIYDGATTGGTVVGGMSSFVTTAGGYPSALVIGTVVTPSSASKTYSVAASASAGTGQISASATVPAYIMVELV